MAADPEGPGEYGQAYRTAKFLGKTVPNGDQLELYALHKVATEDFSKAKAPGMFELRDKAKYNAWKKEHEAGTTPEDAEKRYIAKVRELKAKHGLNYDVEDKDKKPTAEAEAF